MATDTGAESVTTRLTGEEVAILNRYHARLPAMSRSGCLRQLLHDWDRGNGGMRSREELDREILFRAHALRPGTYDGPTWATLAALLWAQNRLYSWGSAIEAARKIVEEVSEAKAAA